MSKIAAFGFLTVVIAFVSLCSIAQAQTRKPSAKEVAAIRDCATKYQDEDEAISEQHCLFKLVAEPCTNSPEGSSNVGTADCYRLEAEI